MIIEVNEVELVELFGAGTKLSPCGGQYLLNGKVFLLEGYDYWTNFAPRIGESRFTYRLSLRIVETKSPQQIAAEEAVQKAESALKAAKEVLKTVKEK